MSDGEAGNDRRDAIVLRPTALASDGSAIAREASGRVVFVGGALPGELVRAELVAEARDYARARAVEIVEPSPHRIAAPCTTYARGCGACQCQHVALAAQAEFKREIVADALRRLGRVDDVPFRPAVDLAPWAFRTTIRAAVAGGRAGFRAARTHDVVCAEECLVAHPLLVELLVAGRYGSAREVVLRCGARTGERLVATKPRRVPIAVPEDVQHVYFHEEVAGRRWRISAGSFFQTRPDGADALAEIVAGAAAEVAGRPAKALDLYSGVGLFAGLLADAGWQVTAVEGSAVAAADARRNLAGSSARVVRADVTRWEPEPADLVVADPSRAGLGVAGVGAVSASAARRLVLVSCDAAALGRDARLLVDAGFALTGVTLVDLFPHSFRVEVVSTFDRAASAC